jgi:CheY-like chemotaxis protein
VITRVLFVDDEPRVLSGMQRLMRPLRARFEACVAVGGEQALAAIEAERFDVVVSDMRMPGMDGAQLLAEVRARKPGIVRFVLSGQTELDVAIRAVSIAHQFLSKPCRAEELFGALERARRALSLLENAPCLRDVVVGIGSLPCAPTACAELERLVEAAEPPMHDVASVIARDVGMSTKALQLVNSSFFGPKKPATDPREAVMLLGGVLVRELALKARVFSASADPFAAPPDEAFAARVGHLASAAAGVAPAEPFTPRALGDALLGLWGIG